MTFYIIWYILEQYTWTLKNICKSFDKHGHFEATIINMIQIKWLGKMEFYFSKGPQIFLWRTKWHYVRLWLPTFSSSVFGNFWVPHTRIYLHLILWQFFLRVYAASFFPPRSLWLYLSSNELKEKLDLFSLLSFYLIVCLRVTSFTGFYNHIKGYLELILKVQVEYLTYMMK